MESGSARKLSTAEVARLVGLRESQVRELVRAGLTRPVRTRRGRAYRFSFQDLVVLYAARRLLEQGVPASRVRRALAALARELPEGRPLSGLRIFADGRNLAVRDGGAAWQPETGQTLLDFGVEEVARLVAAKRETPAASGPSPAAEAQRAFEEGIGLEDEDPEAAAEAYRRAVHLDPELVDAWVNLGRLVHEAGDAKEAARLWHAALARSPDDPVIHFDLALALEDTGDTEGAASHYERALALDADFADAHFNLAALCEKLGRRTDALRHYHAYQKLTRN